jgi:uncharacterized protein
MNDILTLLKERKTEELLGVLNENPELVDFVGTQGASLLMLSIYYGNKELTEFLLKKKKSVTVFEAAACGLVDSLKDIIKKFPDEINAVAPDGFSPIGLASFFNQVGVVKLLIESGADVNQPSKNSFKVAPLNSAAASKNVPVAKLLLENGADVNVKQQEGYSPLHSAAHNGDVEMAKLLLKYKADKLSKTDKEKTPYDFAAEENHKELMEMLRV